jgi:hypothetical protein
MSTDIITGVRQAIQDFITPEIRQIRGDITALDARISALEKIQDARFHEVNAKLDALLNMHNLEIRLAKLEAQRSA